jgi:hypothetical protein
MVLAFPRTSGRARRRPLRKATPEANRVCGGGVVQAVQISGGPIALARRLAAPACLWTAGSPRIDGTGAACETSEASLEMAAGMKQCVLAACWWRRLPNVWHGTFPIHAATPSVVFAANMFLAFITSMHKYNVSIWL